MGAPYFELLRFDLQVARHLYLYAGINELPFITHTLASCTNVRRLDRFFSFLFFSFFTDMLDAFGEAGTTTHLDTHTTKARTCKRSHWGYQEVKSSRRGILDSNER